jgi:hypothetical protein
VIAALGAGITQPGDSQPQYGEGSDAFGQRVGAIAAGYGSATFFTKDLLPTVLHQDPRYFRKGEGKVASRIWYAATRTLVTRQDSGRSNVNASFLGDLRCPLPYRTPTILTAIETLLTPPLVMERVLR